MPGGCRGNLSVTAVKISQPGAKQILSQMRPPLCFCNLIRPSISAAAAPSFRVLAHFRRRTREPLLTNRFATSKASLELYLWQESLVCGQLPAAGRERIAPPTLDLAQRDENECVTSGTCNSKADKTNSENLFSPAEHKRLSLCGACGANSKSQVACRCGLRHFSG